MHGKSSFQEEYVKALTEGFATQTMKTFELPLPQFSWIPVEFLRSWYNPTLAGVDKDETLTWASKSLEAASPVVKSLRVRQKSGY